MVKNNEDNDLKDKKLTNLDSITVNRNPTSENKLANKKYVDDSVGDGTILRFNQTLENYLKVSVENDTYNLTKNNKIQLTDTTTIKYPNSGGYLLPGWRIFCKDKNFNCKTQNFIKPKKKQILPRLNRGPPLCRLLGMLLCTSRHLQTIMVIMYSLVLKELILYKLLK